MLGTVPTLYRLGSNVSVLGAPLTVLSGHGRWVWLVAQAHSVHARTGSCPASRYTE